MLNNLDNKKIPREYQGKLEREVRVHLSNGNPAKVGKFEDFDESYIYLRPCLISEGTYNQKKEIEDSARIETKTSVPIRRDLIGIIEPLSYGYIQNLANSINYSPRKIILP